MKKTITSLAVVALAAGSVTLTPTQAHSEALYDVKLSDYMSGTTDASVGLQRAAQAVQARSGGSGGTVWVDGQYTVADTVQLDEVVNGVKTWQAVRLVGSGVGASLLKKDTAGSMFRMGGRQWGAVSLSNLGYRDIGFQTTGQSYVWELKRGSLTNSQWQDLSVEVLGPGGIIDVSPGTYAGQENGAEYHTNGWTNAMFHVAKTSPLVPMNFTSAHHYVNGNSFNTVWAHHRGNDLVPFWRMRPKSGEYTNNSFRSITGEQNLGGLIELFGPNGGTLDAIAEWDGVCPGYKANVIAIAPNRTTVARGVSIIGSGTVVHSNYAPVRNKAQNIWVASTSQNVIISGSVQQIIPQIGTTKCN